MPNPLSGRRKARANLRDTCQPRGPSRRALADKGVNVRNLSSAPSAHPLEATPPSLPAFLLLRVTRPGRRDRSAFEGNAGAGSAAAAGCGSECPRRSPGAGLACGPWRLAPRVRARAGEPSTSEVSRALQALTRSKQPHLRCLPFLFSVSLLQAEPRPRPKATLGRGSVAATGRVLAASRRCGVSS